MKEPLPSWDPENPFDSADPAFRQAFWQQVSGPENLDMAGMTKREEEELLLHYGPRKERKALKRRLKAEKRAQEKSR